MSTYSEGLTMFCKNRSVKRGGGVAIVTNNKKFSFKKHDMFTGEYEIVAAKTKVKNIKSMLYVFSVYYPPSMNVEEVMKMNDLLSDEILKIQVKESNPVFILAGDTNNKDLKCFEKNEAKMKRIDIGATRGGSYLDTCFSNSEIKTEILEPMWSEHGSVSDHKVVMCETSFVAPKHEYTKTWKRKVTKISESKFCELCNEYDWSIVENMPCSNSKTRKFHEVIESFKDECFPLYLEKRRDDEDPWMTEALKRMSRKIKVLFRSIGRTDEWKQSAKNHAYRIQESKKAYYDREVEKINNGKNKRNLAYTALKNLNCPQRPKQWSVRDLDPKKSTQEIVDELAEFFSKVTSEYRPLDKNEIPISYDRPIYEVTPAMVCQKIKQAKKPHSQVPGDIPPNIINEVAQVISRPVASIFNDVARGDDWPKQWRTEYQTVIPKKPHPESFDELRNLCCTNFLSKILETFVLESISSEIDMSDLQYGGVKGCGTDNFLIEVWNNVLEAVEENGKAVALMSVDFSKAFNRLDHNKCIEKLYEKNGSNQTLGMIAAFLNEREMLVRDGLCLSKRHPVMGGSPQGTKLGNVLFCLAIDDIIHEKTQAPTPTLPTPIRGLDSPETAIPEQYLPTAISTPVMEEEQDSFIQNVNPYGIRRKLNVINDTVLEPELDQSTYQKAYTWAIGYVDDINVGEVIDLSDAVSHFTTGKETKTIRAVGCEGMFGTIKKNGEYVGLKINPIKTQVICFNTAIHSEVRAVVNIEGKMIQSASEIKMLGFYFSENISVSLHVSKTVEKFNRALWSLVHLKRAKMNDNVLLSVYRSMLRSLLEYSSNVFFSMLTGEMTDVLEKCQQKALKIVYGFDVRYDDALIKSGLQRLSVRREKLFENFAMKMSRSVRFSEKWLPQYDTESQRNLRNTKKYIEFQSKTTRLYNSPVFKMRRILNEAFDKTKT